METEIRIRALISRLARLDATQAWEGQLNPTQRQVIDYLSRANRFSRGPSQVADYLATTRGTVSQTLKSLSGKGYVTEHRSIKDKRAISFDLTKKGEAIALQQNATAKALANMDTETQHALLSSLDQFLIGVLRENGGRAFGLCRDCMHFDARNPGGRCRLLDENLSAHETNQICHEQETV